MVDCFETTLIQERNVMIPIVLLTFAFGLFAGYYLGLRGSNKSRGTKLEVDESGAEEIQRLVSVVAKYETFMELLSDSSVEVDEKVMEEEAIAEPDKQFLGWYLQLKKDFRNKFAAGENRDFLM